MPRWLVTLARWLDQVRAGLHGDDSRPVAVEQAARAVGVQVTLAPLSGTLWGLAWSTNRVTVNSDLPLPERRLALAHELAHVGQARGQLADDHHNGELIADWFAQELLMPLEHLAAWPHVHNVKHDPESVHEIAATWQVPRSTVLAQAAWLNYDHQEPSHLGHPHSGERRRQIRWPNPSWPCPGIISPEYGPTSAATKIDLGHARTSHRNVYRPSYEKVGVVESGER